MTRKRKHIPLTQRIRNAYTWIRHPAFLLFLVGCLGIFGLVCALVNPCGRVIAPVHGKCSDGAPFTSPLASFCIGVVLAIIFSLLLTTREPNNGKWNNVQFVKELIANFKKRPKWRKRWFPVAFVIVYIPLAALTIVLNRGTGLYWYNFFGQFVLLLPFLAAAIASWLLTKVRRARRKIK